MQSFLLTLITMLCASLCFSQVKINEFDSDQTGTDTVEFVELAGPPGTSLDSFVLVLFNGSDDASYDAVDLDGEALDENGFFVLGSPYVPNVDLAIWTSNNLQNGADGIGLYFGLDASDFPNNTPVGMFAANLVDGAVYDTDDADDPGLLAVLDTIQTNEDEHNMKDTESIQRNPSGVPKWIVGPPTAGMANSNPMPVEFLSFQVEIKGSKAHLVWTTTREINNDHFVPEISQDGISYNGIAKVDRHGKLPEKQEYTYDHIVDRPGRYFFRIKQVDTNGRFMYSPVRVLDFLSEDALIMYPTVVDVVLTMKVSTEEDIRMTVVNVEGQPVMQLSLRGKTTHALDMSHLSSGLYYVESITNTFKDVKTIYKR